VSWFVFKIEAVAHPDRIEAAHRPERLWRTTKAWGALADAAGLLGDRAAHESALRPIPVPAGDADAPCRERSQRESYNPDLWTDELAFSPARFKPGFKRPVSMATDQCGRLPAWQHGMRRQQPRLLVRWGSMIGRSTSRNRKPIAGCAEAAVTSSIGHCALDTAAIRWRSCRGFMT